MQLLEARSLVSEPTESRSIDLEKRTMTAVFSTSDPDRYETIFRTAGFASRIDAFLRNPVILLNHGGLPLARCYDYTIGPRTLTLATEFDDDELPTKILRMYQRGFLNQFSQRSRVHDYITAWDRERASQLSAEEQAHLEAGRAYVVFTELELLEGSCVTLAGNSWTGVERAIREGLLSADQARSLMEPALPSQLLTPALVPTPPGIPARAQADPPAPADPEPLEQVDPALGFFSTVLRTLTSQ